MPLLGAKDVTRSYGDRQVLDGVSVAIEPGERLGLVGLNGSGKSTLARILAGIEDPDGGEITRSRGVRLGYLPQEPEMDPEATALEAALGGLAAWSEAMARHRAATDAIGERGASEERLAEQAEAAAALERHGGWERSHAAEAMLDHLGVGDPGQRVGSMSGGERRRVAMARLLVAAPDLAILDEPTNHLDIDTIEWLEAFLLERFAGALLLITHDRHLLDRVARRTLEIEDGALYSYDGGWESYLAAKAERIAHRQRAAANRRNFLRRELEWLRRQPKARTGKQKARVDRAHEVLEAAPGANAGRTAAIEIGGAPTGKTILEARELAVEIGGARLVEDLSLALTRGERIGIVGPNGAGKTTLIRTLLGEREPAAGTVVRGANTRVAYLEQTRSALADDESVAENVARGRSHIQLGDASMEIQTYLRRFLFDGGAQRQRVAELSGGERARVALARVLSEDANLVVLDEPTNDLDVETLGALEAALLDFGGTSLIVTHDRWFLDRVATSILAFTGGGQLVHRAGGYTDYRAWRERQKAEEKKASSPPPRRERAAAPEPAAGAGKKLTYGESIELDGLMERIEAAEAEVAELEAGLSAPDFASMGHLEQAAYLERLAAARARAEELVERWSELEARSE